MNFIALLQWLVAKFPAHKNSECFSPKQGITRRNQGNKSIERRILTRVDRALVSRHVNSIVRDEGGGASALKFPMHATTSLNYTHGLMAAVMELLFDSNACFICREGGYPEQASDLGHVLIN